MSVMPSTVEQWLDSVPPNGQAPDEMPSLDPVQLDMSLSAHIQPGLDMNMLGEFELGPDHLIDSMEMPSVRQDDTALLHMPGIPGGIGPPTGALTPHNGQEAQTSVVEAQDYNPTATESDNQSSVSSKPVVASGRRRKARESGEKAAQPNVPLVCYICEGNPTFSDVSHLLTHCSSRAHTKRHFDMKARALTEATAQQLLQTYDEWYEKSEIGPMINKRLREKDEKDQAKKLEAEKRRSTQQPVKRRKVTSRIQHIKREPRATLSSSSVTTESALQQLPPLPFDPNGNPPSSLQTTSYSALLPSHSSNPTMALEDQQLEDLPIPGLQSPNGSEFDLFEMADEYSDDYDQPAKPVLKGKYWPGMDLFDAATEQERRKRNQRKDGSVIRKMKIASQAVETVELVGNTDLDWHRVRDVYDPPSCDEETPSKRRASSGRKRPVTPKHFGRNKTNMAVRLKSEPRTPRVGRHNTADAAQVSGPRRTTRGSAARAQAQIARIARHEIEGAPELSQDSEDDIKLLETIKTEPTNTSGQDHSTRHSTTDTSSDGNGGHGSFDIFHDGDMEAVNEPIGSEMPTGFHGDTRLSRRSRPPLLSLSRNVRSNANSNLSSPTPSTKSVVIRSCGGMENNSELKQGNMMAQPSPMLHQQAMGFPGMGFQGMPRNVWDAPLSQVQYPFPLGNGFNDNLLLPPVLMGNQTMSPYQQQNQQPHPQPMNGIFNDDLQSTMFRTPQSVGSSNQGWQANNPLGLGLPPVPSHGIYNTGNQPWMPNNQEGFDEAPHTGYTDL